ncbi:MAG: hypothetical protein WDO13_10385 [Verrucomicrobiota bacterium]
MAADTREQLAGLLQLGPGWRFPVHIHVLTPDDPLTAKINREASAVFSQGATMKIEAVVPIDDPDAREFVQRQFVTALLWERFFAGTKTFDKNTRLDVVPLWLVEGLREWINEDSEHSRESIVRHALEAGTAPTLAEVTGWNELNHDRLLGLWQRAFSFYLVDSLAQPGERRDDFQEWLNGFIEPGGNGKLHFPTEGDWQRELADATSRSRDKVFTWQETLEEIDAESTITFAAGKDAPVRTCTLDQVATLPRSPALIQAAHEKVFQLTELELRCHPGWQPVLEAYRTALTAFSQDATAAHAPPLFEVARRERDIQIGYHSKIVDYMNWFEVTKDVDVSTSRFHNYFATAKEMERIQADPKHPNPIRANLLQIEAELGSN